MKSKSLDQILDDNILFEPSQSTKQNILYSIKQPFIRHQLIAKDEQIPSFFSYDLTKYDFYFSMVLLIYAFELVAGISIIITSTSLIYAIIKVLLVVILIFIDLSISEKSNSNDNILTEAKYQNNFSILTRKFFSNYLTENELEHMEQSIQRNNIKIREIEIDAVKMLRYLYLLATIKIVIFVADYLYAYVFGGLNWTFIFSKNITFIICFFIAPALYLIIPGLAWRFYGRWIWTGKAITALKNESTEHRIKKDVASENKVGEIPHCVNIIKQRLSINCLASNVTEVLAIVENGDIKRNASGFTVNFEGDKTSRNYKIYSEGSDWIIEIYGILTDSDLFKMVYNQRNENAKKLILCLGMSFQIGISNRESRKLKYSEYLSIKPN